MRVDVVHSTCVCVCDVVHSTDVHSVCSSLCVCERVLKQRVCVCACVCECVCVCVCVCVCADVVHSTCVCVCEGVYVGVWV